MKNNSITKMCLGFGNNCDQMKQIFKPKPQVYFNPQRFAVSCLDWCQQSVECPVF